MAFCASQGRIVFDRGDALALAAQAQVAGDAAPVARGGREARGLVDAAGVLRREPFRLGRVGQRADDGEVERVRRVRPERHEAAAARLAVGVEQLVAADRLDRIRRAGDQMVDRVRVALAPERGRVRAEGDPPVVGVDLDAPGMVELALAEDEAAEDQEAAGGALDGDAPLASPGRRPRRRARTVTVRSSSR